MPSDINGVLFQTTEATPPVCSIPRAMNQSQIRFQEVLKCIVISKVYTMQELVEASRSSELQALDLRFSVYKPGVTFRILSLTKKRGLHQGSSFLLHFPQSQ